MDPALLRNIALQTNDQGAADAQLALAARRLLSRGDEVMIDPDDLPGTMGRLGGGAAVPMWKKFRVTVAMISAGTVDTGGTLFIPLFTAGPMTSIMDAVIAPVEVFTQDPEADPQLVGVDTIGVGAGWRDAEDNLISLVNAVGYSDGPEILTDPDYIAKADGAGATAQDLQFIKTAQVVNAAIVLPSQDELNPPVLADYQKLNAGAFDLWLLISKLPA